MMLLTQYQSYAFMLILRRQNQRFETLIQNADSKRPSREYCAFEKKTISFTAHCSRLLFELKWTGKAFIWRHLHMLPQNQRLTTIVNAHFFLRHAYFAKAESAFWNADSKRRFKTPFTGVLFMLPREEDFEQLRTRLLFELKWTGKAMTSFKRGYMWFCVHASTRMRFALTTMHIFGRFISVLKTFIRK